MSFSVNNFSDLFKGGQAQLVTAGVYCTSSL